MKVEDPWIYVRVGREERRVDIYIFLGIDVAGAESMKMDGRRALDKPKSRVSSHQQRG
jgi:hypothetical protein